MQEAEADPRLRDIRQDLVVVEVHIRELMAQLDEIGGSEAAKKVIRGYIKLAKVVREATKKDGVFSRKRMTTLVNDLGHNVQLLSRNYRAWEDLGNWMDRRIKYMESEDKRLIVMQQMMSFEQLNLLMYQIIRVINERATCPKCGHSVADYISDGIGDLISDGKKAIPVSATQVH